MSDGLAINVFGGSYLLAVIMPSDGSMPEFCQFKRIIGKVEQCLGHDGWEPLSDTPMKRILRDVNESERYFTYYLDGNAGENVRYMFRLFMNGVFTPWRFFDDLTRNTLPAPRNVKVTRNYANR